MAGVFGQSGSKKTEQLETAGSTFSGPEESMILCGAAAANLEERADTDSAD